MTIKHTITCEGSNILVHETDSGTYQVSIQRLTNPLGKGNVLQTFMRLEEAIVASEHFCELHATAKEQGYHLEGGHFVKLDKPKYEVGKLLSERKSPEELATMLS